MATAHPWRVDDIIGAYDNDGKIRKWRIIGIFLGGENQEDVVELETLNRIKNTQGRIIVPIDLLVWSPGA